MILGDALWNILEALLNFFIRLIDQSCDRVTHRVWWGWVEN